MDKNCKDKATGVTFDQVWNHTAEQVRRDLIIALEPHLDGPRSAEVAEHILRLEGN